MLKLAKGIAAILLLLSIPYALFIGFVVQFQGHEATALEGFFAGMGATITLALCFQSKE